MTQHIWRIREETEYLWITNGLQNIKIGKKNKKYNKRIAEHETTRRNNNENVSDICFSSIDIKRIVKYFAKKINWWLKRKHDTSVKLFDLEDLGYFTFAKCNKSYKCDMSCLFTTYFGRAFFKNAYKCFAPTSREFQTKNKNIHFTNVKITQKLISSCAYTTLNLEAKKNNIDVEKLLSPLRKRNRDVIVGVIFEGKNFEQLGNELGVSKQRIHQIYIRSLEFLRYIHQNRNNF